MRLHFLPFFLVPMILGAQEPSPIPSPTPAMDTVDRLKALNAEQLKQAIAAVREKHVEGGTLDDTEMARSTLRGLLDGLYPGLDLTDGKEPSGGDAPFCAETLDGKVGYLRLGSPTPEHLAQLDKALGDFNAKNIGGVVLDLRATPESSDFAWAAQVGERFVPKDKILFALSRSGDKQEKKFTSSAASPFRGVMVVLADSQTAGAAEVIAAVLRANAHAMIVGATTSGRAVEFASIDLGGGHHLRYAVAEASVPGLPPLYPGGLEPDLEVPQDEQERETILAKSLEKGVAGFVFERGRVQMNEAALVAGTDPEIDAAEQSEQLIDRPLQRAVDLVTAIKLFRQRD